MHARLVPIGLEQERAGLAGFAAGFRETPARDDARQRRDIGLSIAAVDAERMQFKNFAGEIFVEPLAVEAAGVGARANRTLVVEIENHRRMRFNGDQQVREFAEHMRTYRLALERAGGRPKTLALGDRHREMIRPKGDQPLDEAGPRFHLRAKTRHRLGAKQSLLDRRLLRFGFGLRGLGLQRFRVRGLASVGLALALAIASGAAIAAAVSRASRNCCCSAKNICSASGVDDSPSAGISPAPWARISSSRKPRGSLAASARSPGFGAKAETVKRRHRRIGVGSRSHRRLSPR